MSIAGYFKSRPELRMSQGDDSIGIKFEGPRPEWRPIRSTRPRVFQQRVVPDEGGIGPLDFAIPPYQRLQHLEK
jgi:hypothetical protein